MKKIALITGGSSGLGAALLIELKKQYTVINASRQFAAEADYNIEVDFSQSSAADTLTSQLNTLNLEPDLLVNNAGIGAYGTQEEVTCEELQRLMQINFLAPVAVTKALLPILQKKAGTIMNICSMAAKIHVPGMGGYCASKAALAMFSETLQAELKVKGIRVITVYPGRINTGFSSRAIKHREVPNTPDNSNVTAQDFAKKVIKTLNSKRNRCFFPWFYPIGVVLVKIFAENYYNKTNLKLWGIK